MGVVGWRVKTGDVGEAGGGKGFLWRGKVVRGVVEIE